MKKLMMFLLLLSFLPSCEMLQDEEENVKPKEIVLRAPLQKRWCRTMILPSNCCAKLLKIMMMKMCFSRP